MTSLHPRTVRQSAFQRTMCCAHGVAELAAVALFLSIDHGASVAGVALPMDGGWTAD